MIDYDKFGFCVKCHRDMNIVQVIDNREQKRFTPDYTERTFKLNDGSKMRVALCMKCNETLKEEDHPKIMEAVIKGWNKETDELVASPLFPRWTPEYKEEHMKVYRDKSIIG